MPKISVIVPIYKVEKYLHRCVGSILNQTFSDFELILVDDGSPDNCPQICDEYAKKDNRVFVIHKENGGLSDARNSGIEWALENSDSEWITFIDSDDWVHEKYLELLYNGAVENNCEISACKYYETKGELPEEELGEIKIFLPEDFWLTKLAYAVVSVVKLYKKALWNNYRFPKGKIHEDEFTTYKLIFDSNSICWIEKELYYYYFNDSGITKSVWNPKRIVIFEALKKQIAFFRRKKLKGQYVLAIKRLIKRYIGHIEKASMSNKYAKEIKLMRKGLGRSLIKYRKYFPIRHNDGLYLIAYPKKKKLIALRVELSRNIN